MQAWLHGSVIPSLYHEFKHFGLYGKLDRVLTTHIDLFAGSDILSFESLSIGASCCTLIEKIPLFTDN